MIQAKDHRNKRTIISDKITNIIKYNTNTEAVGSTKQADVRYFSSFAHIIAIHRLPHVRLDMYGNQQVAAIGVFQT